MNKRTILQQSTLNALFYYLRATIEAINLLWFFPLILTSEQIGLYQVITSSTYLIAYITQVGLPQGVVRYMPRFKNNKKSFLSFIILTTIIIFALFAFIAIIFKNQFALLFKKKSAKVVEHFSLILGTAFFLLLMMILKSWHRALLRSTLPTFIQNVLLFFLINISGIFYYFNLISFNSLLISILIIYFFCFILMFLNLLFIGEMRLSLNFTSLKLPYFLKEFAFYNICTMVGNNGFSIVTKIDAVMISSLIGLKSNGIYAIIVSIPKLVEIPRKAIKQISVPLISNYINNEDWKSIKSAYKDISLNQFTAGMFCFILIFVNLDFLFNIIPNGEIRKYGKLVVFFLSLTKLIDSSMSIGNDIMLMSKYYWFNIISLILLATFTIITNRLMIPIWNIAGAAAATSLSFFLYNLSICLFIWNKTKLHPFSFKMVIVIFIGVFLYFFNSLIPIFKNDFINILLRMCFFIPIYLLFVISFNITPDLKQFLKNKFAK